MERGATVKKTLSVMSLLALVSIGAFGQSANKETGKTSKMAQQVMELNIAWAEAITKGDAATLDSLFADDMIVTAGNGTLRDKAGEIKDAAGAPDPEFQWTNPFTTTEVRVKVYGETAVVTGLAKWGFKYKGQQINNERRYTHTYVRQNGKWRIVAQQTSSNLYKKP